MEFTWLSRWQPQLLALLRIVTGLLFLEHGLSKFFGFPVPFPVSSPLPPLLVAAGVIELVAGVLVTRRPVHPAGAFIAVGRDGGRLFHAAISRRASGRSSNMGEAAILFCFIFLYLAAAGPGAWSIDGARTRNAPIR